MKSSGQLRELNTCSNYKFFFFFLKKKLQYKKVYLPIVREKGQSESVPMLQSWADLRMSGSVTSSHSSRIMPGPPEQKTSKLFKDRAAQPWKQLSLL